MDTHNLDIVLPECLQTRFMLVMLGQQCWRPLEQQLVQLACSFLEATHDDASIRHSSRPASYAVMRTGVVDLTFNLSNQ